MRASSIAGATGGQALRIRHGRILRVNRKSGNLPELVEADTLRERECGVTPRSIREAFLLRGRIFWRQALREDGFLRLRYSRHGVCLSAMRSKHSRETRRNHRIKPRPQILQ